MADALIVPPHSNEAEEAVLGSLLIDSEAVLRIAGFLQPEHFYAVKHQWVYEAMLALQNRREPIDLLTVSHELSVMAKLDEIGGEAFIAQLTNAVPTALNVEAYARSVESLATRRRMITAAGDIARIAYDQALPIDQVIEKSEATVFGVTEGRGEGHMVPIRKAVGDFFERIEYLHEHRDEPLGIPTGYGDLDKLTGGLQKGDLLIVAARPGVGKTSLMLNLGYHAAHRHRQRVAIFSLEMSNEQLVQRFIASETGIDSQRLRVADLKDEEWGALTRVSMQMADQLIFLDDTPSLSPLDLRVKARRIYQEYGLDLIIVDYLQLMSGEANTRNDNRVQEISYISRSLKGIARELKVPLIAGSQLSRLVEQRSDKRPMLSDLRESGCLVGDTLITLASTGERVPIRELVNCTKVSVLALEQESMCVVPAVVTNAFSTGIKPVYRLSTRLGRSIMATANHPFRVWDGWVRLDQIHPGDRIAVPRRIAPGTGSPMQEDELALLGHLIGDGCVLPTHAVQYTTRERDLADSVAALSIQVFGEQVRPRINPERGWYQVYLASTRKHTHRVHSPVADWLHELGLWGKRSFEKFVPELVFQQPPERIAVFLRHLWSTDGCIRMRYGRATYPAIYYASSSLRLAQDVQSLLLRLGINARVRRQDQHSKGRDQFQVIVSGKSDIATFVELIGAAGAYKRQSLAQIEVFMASREANTNRDIVPREAWVSHVRPAMRDHGVTHRELHQRLGIAYAGMTLFKHNLSRHRALQVAKAVDAPDLAVMATSDIYWDEVESIEPAGEAEVFDLTVPGPHNFIANDIFAHNSIEQDSDIVMFIYRDELYNPDTEFKNIAEVSVAKNRNGPTGKAMLFFDKRLTSFKNLAKERIEL